ncbi:hypothetical protein C7S14_3046 [Burkholderia cepacia]|nr:hypothetical protein C7S14_3046 [Burkholderia cepacia]
MRANGLAAGEGDAGADGRSGRMGFANGIEKDGAQHARRRQDRIVGRRPS